MRRRINLRSSGVRLLDLLQRDDIRVVALNFFKCLFDSNRSRVRVGVIPDLAELHIKLEQAKSTHRRRTNEEVGDLIRVVFFISELLPEPPRGVDLID